ncbi:hypothetical protein Goshw_007699 [Gossypium schwendimanii]|uniref:Dof-type domain-containing protein n=1 Tax=Gossypium schwendimanii TaxID=34291 RepID=A0A7J9LUJ7_GOSSC|nr:hypothetical protein [Gossypium schwendimanii]
MSELNDSSSIKLFGKMIPLLTFNQDETLVLDSSNGHLLSSSNSLGAVNSNHGLPLQVPIEDKEKNEEDDYGSRVTLSERKPSSLESSKNEEKSETNSQEKALKKPDKILPCPRCNSKETKFCYYNNYNVNQPRHFCKNCQRYWTDGGAMRNVPVGAGRRKTKSSSSSLHYHHVMISEAILGAQASAVNQASADSCVFTFGSDSSVFSLPRLPPSTLYRPGFPASFYSSPTYRPSVVPVATLSLASINQCAPNTESSSPTPTWPALGKHSRDEKGKPSADSNISERRASSNSKALRIDDDTEETAKSSMLATLRIKTRNTNSGIFDGFQSKTSDDRNYRLTTFSMLRANPAALSRSLHFHENT